MVQMLIFLRAQWVKARRVGCDFTFQLEKAYVIVEQKRKQYYTMDCCVQAIDIKWKGGYIDKLIWKMTM